MARWLALLGFAVTAGCGRLSFDPIGETRNGDGGADATRDAALATLAEQAYLKGGIPGSLDYVGWCTTLSADGSTLAIGAPGDASNAMGINGNQADNSATSAGAVFVFDRTGTTWTLAAYVKASNASMGDQFGTSVALSGDGATLAVGAVSEGSSATGVNGNQNDNSISYAGAAYVFTRGGSWTQQAYLKSSTTSMGDYFGSSVSLSGTGDALAVGSSGETAFSGAVSMFTRAGTTWSAQTQLRASNPGGDDRFGANVTLSADGATLAVTAPGEDSSSIGIGGNQADNSANTAGAVYLFARAGSTWSQQAYIKASNTSTVDQFGFSVSLSADGATLAVGAETEDSGATGINGDQADESAMDAGAAYVFARVGATWIQEAYVKAANAGATDRFGSSVALTGDGATLVVGAAGERSGATGVGGDATDNSVPGSGAAYVFTRAGTLWTQQAYVKASNPGVNDLFGSSLAVSADGSTLAVGAWGEDSGIPSDKSNNAALDAGAVYIFQ